MRGYGRWSRPSNTYTERREKLHPIGCPNTLFPGLSALTRAVLRRRPGLLYERYSLFNVSGVLVAKLFRIPLVVSGRTYAFAIAVIVAAAAASGLVVRRRLDRLDLVAVLKTRE